MDPTTDVEVRIAQGTYVAGQTTWTTFLDGHMITFLPVDYVIGGPAPTRPVFRSDGSDSWWLRAQLSSTDPGRTTGLRFYYLRVEKYHEGGLMINGRYETVNGHRVPGSTGANGNTIYGMYFYQLGSKYTTLAGYGFAALDLVNSSDNLIRNSHFINVENEDPYGNYIHGVYLAHGSSNNQITGNRFQVVSGDAVRIRNRSSDNEITGNTMDRVARTAYVVDWFCDGDCVTSTNPQECAGQGNKFHGNDLVSGYLGSSHPASLLVPTGQRHTGPGCPALTADRLMTY
jgi:hypothetical protein